MSVNRDILNLPDELILLWLKVKVPVLLMIKNGEVLLIAIYYCIVANCPENGTTVLKLLDMSHSCPEFPLC